MATSLAVLSRLAAAIPASWDDGLARVLARLTPSSRQAAARANASMLFPGADADDLARSATRSYARFLIEYLRELGRADDPVRNPLTVGPGVREALDSGRGLVMCTAHVGNWELGARTLARLGRPIKVIAEPQYARAWRDTILASKQSAGIEIVAPGVSPRALIRALSEGAVIGLLVDGAGYTQGRATHLAGHTITLPSGPARLAALSGAVLAGGTCFRTSPGHFASELHALGGTEHAPVHDADALHAAIAQWLEDLLFAHPGEWCIFRPFFSAAAAMRRAA
jgi:KDO2-lipid IV(A) lauroyltransferase